MKDVFRKDIFQVTPSLITLDMLNIYKQVKELEENGVNMLHIDILDGHFSPSMPLGFELVRQLKPKTNLAFDGHVMTDSPEYFVDELIDIGVEQIVFHMETANHVDGLVNKIHNAGIRAGVALKPSTPISDLEYIIDKCDTVLLMLINPGYASSKGESQVSYAERKISDLRDLIDKRNLPTLISIDGRVSLKNMEEYAKYGVNLFVGGTTCIKRDDIAGSIKRINDAISAGIIRS